MFLRWQSPFRVVVIGRVAHGSMRRQGKIFLTGMISYLSYLVSGPNFEETRLTQLSVPWWRVSLHQARNNATTPGGATRREDPMIAPLRVGLWWPHEKPFFAPTLRALVRTCAGVHVGSRPENDGGRTGLGSFRGGREPLCGGVGARLPALVPRASLPPGQISKGAASG